MRSATYAVLVFTLGLALVGCKSEAEKQLSEVTDKQTEMVGILKGVTDKESAKAADVKLKAIAKDLTAIFERMKTTNPPQDEQKRLMEKYKAPQEQARKDMEAEMTRISKIPGAGQELFDGMMEISSAAMRAEMGRIKK
jgi:hypothetical protein